MLRLGERPAPRTSPTKCSAGRRSALPLPAPSSESSPPHHEPSTAKHHPVHHQAARLDIVLELRRRNDDGGAAAVAAARSSTHTASFGPGGKPDEKSCSVPFDSPSPHPLSLPAPRAPPPIHLPPPPPIHTHAHQGRQVRRAIPQHQEFVGVDEGHEVVGGAPAPQAAVVQRDLGAVRAGLGLHCTAGEAGRWAVGSGQATGTGDEGGGGRACEAKTSGRHPTHPCRRTRCAPGPRAQSPGLRSAKDSRGTPEGAVESRSGRTVTAAGGGGGGAPAAAGCCPCPRCRTCSLLQAGGCTCGLLADHWQDSKSKFVAGWART